MVLDLGDAGCKHGRVFLHAHIYAAILLRDRRRTALVLEALGSPDYLFPVRLQQVRRVAANGLGILRRASCELRGVLAVGRGLRARVPLRRPVLHVDYVMLSLVHHQINVLAHDYAFLVP